MAKVQLVKEPVVPVKPKIREVVLTLSVKEAEAVQALLGKVTGDPEHSDRKYIHSVWEALDHAGIVSRYIHTKLVTENGEIEFPKNTPLKRYGRGCFTA